MFGWVRKFLFGAFVCPNCKYENREDANSCSQCGYDFQRKLRATIRELSLTLGRSKTTEDHYQEALSRHLSGRSKYDEAINSLIDVALQNDDVAYIAKVHGIDRATLREVYSELVLAGAGQWVRGHYVPVATFVLPLTMGFVLSRRGRMHNSEIAHTLLQYWETGDTGLVL